MGHVRNEQRGFTLLELLVAITIFTVSLLGIAGMQLTSITNNSKANTLSVATALAYGALEKILALDEEDALFDADLTGAAWDLDPETDEDARSLFGAGQYTATYNIQTGQPVSNMARVEVTVNGPKGRTVTLGAFKRTQ